MYYIENQGKIVLADSDKKRFENTLPFMPQFKGLPVSETARGIENLMFVDSVEWIEWKAVQVRTVRDNYLCTYVDPLVGNPLRWAEMTAAEQERIKAYRQYLLDVPDDESFPKTPVLTFDAWCAQITPESEVTDVDG